MDYEEFDDAEDELRDEEYPDESDMLDDEESDLVRCAACGAEVYEESVQCPVCGEYLTADTNPLSSWPMGFIIFGIVGIIATIWVLLIVS